MSRFPTFTPSYIPSMSAVFDIARVRFPDRYPVLHCQPFYLFFAGFDLGLWCLDKPESWVGDPDFELGFEFGFRFGSPFEVSGKGG